MPKAKIKWQEVYPRGDLTISKSIDWDIETTHLKTGRNIRTKVISEVLLTYIIKLKGSSQDVTDNSTDWGDFLQPMFPRKCHEIV
jgi:hypothetical protein